ncbi:hypothetical protein SFBM_0540 [Candidatus Arthromitus sp. SFB-mouse-Japan]|uniref:hypothetical protein n=1 Tax=Candidatus Arthromitus sp. SFB-mouse TaxID=49118 RepID=UPI00021B7F52|nr:hypothetical protein [Candidatus Arthromitus sp. SFB-mouse]EIA23400.1 hypothetical protein SFB2_164G1 [Candidatus Arthromitus sp. SFB-2]EIA24703.1 hypothetical protein SFB1_044G4 [Candidatus Arthromitus sp. SFB-1]EIA26680.1 hypothetical protein SFB3_005G3 [Candidatus Arthromitus sp. SFB-3]EIA26926.1 hypothetical protein SFB4_219G8 [Candidatus Arthromitus sp. SFB-4]EIA28523.1 hypothetical protein SFB6_042G9 [Candidatus Arthromitus sp. SFB-co]EIA30589.1 hypothetical protein SFBSU_006G270 [Ca
MSNSSNVRNEIESIVRYVYVNILKSNISSDTLNSWVNRLTSKQVTLYDFLFTVISPNINSLSISTLIQNLYIGILGKDISMTKNSELVAVFNNELRKYGNKKRALRKVLLSFVGDASLKKYCKRLGINAK